MIRWASVAYYADVDVANDAQMLILLILLILLMLKMSGGIQALDYLITQHTFV